MARILSAAQAAALAGQRRQEFWRVLTTDPDGNQADLSTLAGHNWIEGGDLDNGIDQPIAGATIRLRRDHGALSLSPLREDSTLNRDATNAYAPFLDVGRWIAVECQVVDPAVSAVPIAEDWIRVFEGSIDDVDPAGDKLVILARDLGAALADSWLPTPTAAVVAGDTPVPVEEVIQGMLDTALGAGNVTLYTPVSPLYESTRFGYQRETLASAIQRLVESFGWDCRYKWDAGTSSFRLTLFQPPRTKVDPDILLTRYRSLKKFAVSRRSVRNTVRIYYSDPVGGRHNVFHNDAASQARYGTRPIIIEEASDSTISSDLEADTMALALLADLKDPSSEGECDAPLLPHVELNDLVRLPPNAIHFNTNQDLAVIGIRHSFSASSPSSTVLTLRGRPAGAYRSWLRRGGPPIQGGGITSKIERPSCWFESVEQSGLIERVAFNARPGNNAPASPFLWRTRTTARGDVGDWTPWSEGPLPVTIELARDPTRVTQLEGEVLQADGQTWHADWSSAGAPPGLDDTTGHVDPTKPLAGTAHFIPRATDIDGMILDPGTLDSRAAPMNGMFRAGFDTLGSVLDGGGYRRTGSGYVDGSGRIVTVLDAANNTDITGTSLRDGARRAQGAIGDYFGGLASGAKDSRSAPLNGMFRAGTDTADGILETAGKTFVDSTYLNARRPVAVYRAGAAASVDGDALAAALYGAEDNLVVNGNGESGALGSYPAGWSHNSGTPFVTSSTEVKLGTRSLLFFNNPATGFQNSSDYQALGAFAVGDVIEFGCWVKVTDAVLGISPAWAGLALAHATAGAGAFELLATTGNPATTFDQTANPTVAVQIVAGALGWVFVRGAVRVKVAGVVKLLAVFGFGGSVTGHCYLDGIAARRRDAAGYVGTLALDESGTLKENVRQSDGVTSRVIAKGHSAGTARHGASVSFPQTYQNPPLILLRGGILSEPRTKWTAGDPDGSNTGIGPNAALPVYEDMTALNLGPSGFTLRARLRQKAGSTARAAQFASGNAATGLGASVLSDALVNAPSNDDTYHVRFTVALAITHGSAFNRCTLSVTVAIDVDATGTGSPGPIERATRTYTLEARGADESNTWGSEDVAVVVSAVGAGGKVRIRVKDVIFTDGDGSGGFTLSVHGKRLADDLVSGVAYNTSADTFASKTPDVDDVISWEAIEVS